jgi:cytochrome c oxidase subunit 2
MNGEGGKGPPLIGVFGSVVKLEGGQTVTADEDYIHNSIRSPQSQIVEGFRQPLMPTYFKEQLTEEHLLQIMTYIKSLSPTRTQGAGVTAPGPQNNQMTGTTSPEGQGAKTPDAQRSNPVGSTPPSKRLP